MKAYYFQKGLIAVLLRQWTIVLKVGGSVPTCGMTSFLVQIFDLLSC